MTSRVLDWRPNPDPRSLHFLVSLLDCYAGGKERKSIRRTKSLHLDQGQEGACTGFGAEHVRALSPGRQVTSNSMAQEIYHRARFLDEWAGEDYEGSSVNGAMKAEREMGYITGWRWCRTTAELRHALSYHGAVEAGTWWYEGMIEPDEDGFLHVTGSRIGGHAYALAGYGMWQGRRRYRVENSWGPAWGDNGGAWIWEDDLVRLMEDEGEFAVPTKVRM
jgi:hypothetical protein